MILMAKDGAYAVGDMGYGFSMISIPFNVAHDGEIRRRDDALGTIERIIGSSGVEGRLDALRSIDNTNSVIVDVEQSVATDNMISRPPLAIKRCALCHSPG